MKIKNEYKVREMAGEHVVIMQGRLGSDMTRIISLNESSLYLWQAICGKDFDTDTLTDLLIERYDIDRATASDDARRWVEKLAECGLVEIQ
ncbi:MAG: PqqD family protein [Alistipes sp.]|nr:PqqD family protein [Alistipes sp.]MDE7129252.1 PqqD family protein [Alistipes sp.]